MRILVIAAAVVALTSAAAQAQMGGGGGRHQRGDDAAKADNKPKVDEKAYKDALERIPEPKEKYDPWSGARPTDPAKKQK
jgi:hypothetical protein